MNAQTWLVPPLRQARGEEGPLWRKELRIPSFTFILLSLKGRSKVMRLRRLASLPHRPQWDYKKRASRKATMQEASGSVKRTMRLLSLAGLPHAVPGEYNRVCVCAHEANLEITNHTWRPSTAHHRLITIPSPSHHYTITITIPSPSHHHYTGISRLVTPIPV